MVFRSFYGSSEPGTPPHPDSIPSNPLRPHFYKKHGGYYNFILASAIIKRWEIAVFVS